MPRSQAAGETYLALRTANLNEPQPAMSGFKLNLGCGTTRIPGYIGVDVNRGGGADLIASATCLPFKEGSIAEVFTSHMLEHLLGMDLDLAMREIHRTLMPQGQLPVRVPYGLEGLYDPFHFHAFNEDTFARWARESTSLQWSVRFRVLGFRIVYLNIPFEWHLRKYAPRLVPLVFAFARRLVGVPGDPLRFFAPMPGQRELNVVLERVDHRGAKV